VNFNGFSDNDQGNYGASAAKVFSELGYGIDAGNTHVEHD
jgi:uncharacterized protein with beta-barrel porin domain